MRYLLDTNTVSQLIRANPLAIARLTQHSGDRLFISAVTEAEIRFGLAKNPGATRLRLAAEAFIERVGVLDFTPNTAAIYGTLRSELETSGMPMSPLDILIAATALEHARKPAGMVLVTNDRAFARVRGLLVEDWTQP